MNATFLATAPARYVRRLTFFFIQLVVVLCSAAGASSDDRPPVILGAAEASSFSIDGQVWLRLRNASESPLVGCVVRGMFEGLGSEAAPLGGGSLGPTEVHRCGTASEYVLILPGESYLAPAYVELKSGVESLRIEVLFRLVERGITRDLRLVAHYKLGSERLPTAAVRVVR